MVVYKPAEGPFAYNEKGEPICGAKTRNGSKTCKQTRIDKVNFRCRMHGGVMRRGIANASTKTGRYSVDLPTRLLGRYENLMADGTLLSLRDDIALVGANIGEELATLKADEETPDMDVVIGKVEAIADNWKSWDWTRMDREMSELADAVKGRQQRQQAMSRIRSLIKDKAALVAQENRVLLEREAMIPVDQVMLLMRALTGVVRRVVRDPRILGEIEVEFSRVVRSDAPAIPGPR
jgi:hypothetical protein